MLARIAQARAWLASWEGQLWLMQWETNLRHPIRSRRARRWVQGYRD